MRPPIPWRTFLPTEHGSWGFVLEPIVLGLSVAPNIAACAGSAAFLLLFLSYRPMALGWSDVRRRRRYPRTVPGLATGFILATAGGLLLWLRWWPSIRSASWPAAALYGVALAAYALASESRAHRDLPRKLAGAFAAAPTATLVALTNPDLPPPMAYSLTGLMLLRTLPSLFYVRERLELSRGKPPHRLGVALWHAIGAAGALGLCAAANVNWLAATPHAMLGVRSSVGLSASRNPVEPRTIGLQELGWGVATVVLVSIAIWYS